MCITIILCIYNIINFSTNEQSLVVKISLFHSQKRWFLRGVIIIFVAQILNILKKIVNFGYKIFIKRVINKKCG